MHTARSSLTRREFLKTSTLATTGSAVAASCQGVFAAGSDTLRVGLIGCGARGIGAAMNCVLSTPGVEITALADVFPDRVAAALKRLQDNTKGKWIGSYQKYQPDNRDVMKLIPQHGNGLPGPVQPEIAVSQGGVDGAGSSLDRWSFHDETIA